MAGKRSNLHKHMPIAREAMTTWRNPLPGAKATAVSVIAIGAGNHPAPKARSFLAIARMGHFMIGLLGLLGMVAAYGAQADGYPYGRLSQGSGKIIPESSATATAITASELFNWAEKQFPDLFPQGPSNFSVPFQGNDYVVRAYTTQNYLGVSNNHAFGLGPFTGGSLVDFGTANSFRCQVFPDTCVAPASWTPMLFDYGLTRRCVRTPYPDQPNFYLDNTDCASSTLPQQGEAWTTAVQTETRTGDLCTGAVTQSFQINGPTSPVTQTWTSISGGYAVNLRIDFANIANPCNPQSWTWVPLATNGSVHPKPNHLVQQVRVTYNRNLSPGAGATHGFATLEANWRYRGDGGKLIDAHIAIAVDFFTDIAEMGRQPGLPRDVIGIQKRISGDSAFFFVNFRGDDLTPPIHAPLGKETELTLNWRVILQHAIDEELIPSPADGWDDDTVVTTATNVGIELVNLVVGKGGPMANLTVRGYKVGSF